MPGVPSGRGCDACRKQKKKCDQGKPICSRCARLQIPCVGSGQRRFKFKEQNIGDETSQSNFEGANRRDRQVSHRSKSGSQSPGSPTNSSRSPTLSPNNSVTLIRDTLVRALEYTDLRYDLRCFGSFITDIPKLLGVNQALDASVDALITIHSTLHIEPQPVVSLARYISALQALRQSLVDPSKALTIETMVAIYFVMICQNFMGRFDDTFMGHGRVMAHLLDVLTDRDIVDKLEAKILSTLSIIVIGYSVLCPEIRIETALRRLAGCWNTFETEDCEEAPIPESMLLPSLIKYAELIKYPANHRADIESSYAEIKDEYLKFKTHLTVTKAMGVTLPTRTVARNNTSEAAMLVLLCLFNAVLRTFDPCSENLLQEAQDLDDHVLEHGRDMLQYRPLGSSYVPCCLAAALVNPAADRVKQLRDMFMVYEPGLSSTRWLETATWLRYRFDRLCKDMHRGHSPGTNLFPVNVSTLGSSDLSFSDIKATNFIIRASWRSVEESDEDTDDGRPTGACQVM